MELAKLSTDKRFPRLSGTDIFALYIWIAEVTRAGKIQRAITFGWMFPTALGPTPMQWNKRTAGTSKEISKEAKVQLVRLSLHAQARPLLELLQHLCDGKSLIEASTAASISGCPVELTDIALAREIVLRPSVLLPSRTIGNDHAEHCRATLSPTRASAYCASVILLEKSVLLKNLGIQETETDPLSARQTKTGSELARFPWSHPVKAGSWIPPRHIRGATRSSSFGEQFLCRMNPDLSPPERY